MQINGKQFRVNKDGSKVTAMRMTREQAWNIATRHGIDLKTGYYSKGTDEVESILAAAKEAKYKKPKNANGSQARMFFAYLVRAYGKQD